MVVLIVGKKFKKLGMVDQHCDFIPRKEEADVSLGLTDQPA